MVTFNRRYFASAMALFLVEIYIALYVNDAWIRPFGGDLLVVILIFWLVKAFLNVHYLPAAIGVLLFSYNVEVMQYFHIVNLLGLQDSRFWVVVIGTGFHWLDMVCYTVGIGLVILFERFLEKRGQDR